MAGAERSTCQATRVDTRISATLWAPVQQGQVASAPVRTVSGLLAARIQATRSLSTAFDDRAAMLPMSVVG